MSQLHSKRYEARRLLYESAATRVVLAKDHGSGRDCILKTIRKDQSPRPYHNEADLLRGMTHPGIPTLYETSEDEAFFTIVEEYAPGQSLDLYLTLHQHISRETFLKLSIQLCEILIYLHTRWEKPVLYLDFKPEHIIICGQKVMLIDYDAARRMSESEENFQTFGTKTYASPELRQGKRTSVQMDVYGMGRMLRMMAEALAPMERFLLLPILVRATCPIAMFRTRDVFALHRKLVRFVPAKKSKTKGHLYQKIAVVGSESGVGCTHVAIALVSYLNRAGYCAFYRNETSQPVVERMLQRNLADIEEDGIIYHEYFRSFYEKGSIGTVGVPSHAILVSDYGTTLPQDAAIILCIISRSVWKQTIAAYNGETPIIWICNDTSTRDAVEWSRQTGQTAYVYPHQRDPFFISHRVRRFFDEMIRRDLLAE